MNNMGAQALLAVLLLIIGTVKADEGGVWFSGEKFTMSCPDKGNWYKNDNKPSIRTNERNFELLYDSSTKGKYYCEYNKEGVLSKYYFYVQGKACANCFELEAHLFGLVIIADVVGTAFLMMIIYRCTKKKSSPGPHSSKAPARPGGRAPPVPSPDYEPLNHHTRSQDPYSVVNRTG